MISRISMILSRLSLALSALGLTVMTLVICWQVFARYVLSSAPSWTEQAALYLMIWFILFAAAAGVREGFHIRISLLDEILKPKKKKVLRILCHLIVLFFSIAMVYGGTQLVMLTWEHVIPVIGLPRGSIYIPVALSGLLMAFFSIEHILAETSGNAVRSIWN